MEQQDQWDCILSSEFKIYNLQTYNDHRGFFLENYSKKISDDLCLSFKQDNLSYSKKNVIRGLHYQWDKPMGKMVTVINGSIKDYIVDIRKDSPNFGKVYSFVLTDKNRKALWVPAGYAHGFEALEDSYVFYKCTEFYNKEKESGINFFDKNLNIRSTIGLKNAIMSDKDSQAMSLQTYLKDPKFFMEK